MNLGDSVKDGFFDVAYFSGSISLMPEPHNALLNVAKLLKPGGRIIITQTFQNKPRPSWRGSGC